METTYDCLVLFSGGLDSLLAAKVLQEQNLRVLGLHFTSPFFGSPEKTAHWSKEYGLDVLPVDIGETYTRMLVNGCRWGFGKGLNPCVDCKILMLRLAKEMLGAFQAEFLVSGEVVGQRPMSQRKDTLGLIRKEAGVSDILLRPLSAAHLPPTPMETSGRVDRSRLPAIRGRGRKSQLQLAEEFRIPEVPPPAGGCLLTDPESVRRFWPLLKNLHPPRCEDFELSKVGRQLWWKGHWLVIGRNRADNEAMLNLISSRDIVFKLLDIPGPLAVARQYESPWPRETIESAARFMLGFSPKAKRARGRVTVRIASQEQVEDLSLSPETSSSQPWGEPTREEFEQEKRQWLTSY